MNWRQRLEQSLRAAACPAAQPLDWRRVYILPTRFGGLWLLCALLLYLLGSNDRNNLVLLLALALLALFVVSPWPTVRNLAGLRLRVDLPPLLETGRPVSVRLGLESDRPRWELHLYLPDQPTVTATVPTAGLTWVDLPLLPPRRGPWCPGVLRLSSSYPLGLFRAWTYIDPDWQSLCYPAVLNDSLWLRRAGVVGGDRQTHQVGEDDLDSLAPYRPGESLARVAWRQLAQGRGWWTKQFASPSGEEFRLRLADVPGADLEEQLSRLTGAVLALHRSGYPYALDLGAQPLAVGQGEAHRDRALTRLARYGLP